jgi:hypothetical protein
VASGNLTPGPAESAESGARYLFQPLIETIDERAFLTLGPSSQTRGTFMRIAISGTHRSGKSTLVETLSALLPKYTAIDEPYNAMVEDGYDFCHPPSLEDFEAQLEHSMESLREGGADALFDRCPVDFLGYISIHEDAGSFDFGHWLPRVRAAIQTLDLIVLVPIEARDRIAFSPSDDDEGSREAVDEKLKEIWLEDPFELGVEVLEVGGGPEGRARAVLQRIREREAT